MVQSKKRLSRVIYLKMFVFGQAEPFYPCNLLYATGSFTASANENAHQKDRTQKITKVCDLIEFKGDLLTLI